MLSMRQQEYSIASTMVTDIAVTPGCMNRPGTSLKVRVSEVRRHTSDLQL